MKLNTKFSLSIASFIIISGLLSGFIIFSFSRVTELRNFQIQTSNAITEWFKIRIFLTDMISVNFDVTTVADAWKTRKDEFNTAFDTLDASPLRSSLSEDTNQLLDNTHKLLEMVNSSFFVIDDQMDSITKKDIQVTTKNRLVDKGIAQVYFAGDSFDHSTIALLYNGLNSGLVNLKIYSEPFQGMLENIKNSLDTEVSQMVNRVTLQSLLLLVITSIVIFMVISYIASRIVHRLSLIGSVAGNLADKDLTGLLSIPVKDEIGDLANNINQTCASLNMFMNTVKVSAAESTQMSETISFSSGSVTSATTEITSNIISMKQQFAKLESTVQTSIEALETMSSFLITFMTDINHQNSSIKASSNAISDVNESVTVISRKGQEKVDQIAELKKVAQEGEEKIEHTESLLVGITAKLDEVNSFISMINSIAEQTSILSMNAAIESAHAGEAGKGFAVVADEIQKLAESTTENAQLITTTLTEIIENVKQAQKSSHIATSAFGNTTDVIDQLSYTLNDIVAEIGEIDTKTSHLTVQSEDVLNSTQTLSTKTEKLDSLRKTVITGMKEMESIFSETNSGITEISYGTEDILSKIVQINDLSIQSKQKMDTLHTLLMEFTTRVEEEEAQSAP